LRPVPSGWPGKLCCVVSIFLLTSCVARVPIDDDGQNEPTPTACPLGLPCNPIAIDTFPFYDTRDTWDAPASDYNNYSCAPLTNEGGPEFWYRVDIVEAGVITAVVVDETGVDVDVHILEEPQVGACRVRDDVATAMWVEPSSIYIAVDTWVDGSGAVLGGPYSLIVDFLPLASGPCALEAVDLRMYWDGCARGVDCVEEDRGSGFERFLRTPAFGPVVKEAHLVTDAETFLGGWPVSFTDGIDNHYGVSQGVSGFVTNRTEPWAPAGEGGSQFGQGATGAPIPVLDEAWYVNMYWRDRPAGGTRMLVLDAFTGRAVVASAGYETGPGSNTAIGGAVEEVHQFLGTFHRDSMVMGFLLDQSLALGPIACW